MNCTQMSINVVKYTMRMDSNGHPTSRMWICIYIISQMSRQVKEGMMTTEMAKMFLATLIAATEDGQKEVKITEDNDERESM